MTNAASQYFVTDTPNFVIMRRNLDKECIYVSYHFDSYRLAKQACEDIADIKDKLVMDAVFNETDPMVYKPQPLAHQEEIEQVTVEDYRSKLIGIIA